MQSAEVAVSSFVFSLCLLLGLLEKTRVFRDSVDDNEPGE
jgi:hypothetical protein